MLHWDAEALACGAAANQDAPASDQAAVSAIVSSSPGLEFLVAGIRSPLSSTESLY
jgi:hypothetical protein